MRRGGVLGSSVWRFTGHHHTFASRALVLSGGALWASGVCQAKRFASHEAPLSAASPAVVTHERTDQEHGGHNLPSTHVQEDTFDAEGFDELEAASQEVHDLCYAMIAYLRRADPDGTKDLFQARTKRSFREPKPERQRRMLHGHHDRTQESKNMFASRKDFDEASQLFLQWGDKLLLLLKKPVLDRLIESAGKSYRDNRSDGIQRFKRPLERATWRTFPHRWYKHAPFEVQQLRADIPESAVLNTRFYRDHCTLRYLFTLMQPQHAYRGAIEKRLFDITRHYDPYASQKDTSQQR